MEACDKKGEGGKAMAMRIRVVSDKEGEGDEAGDGVGDEGGVRRKERWLWWQEQWQRGLQATRAIATATATTWVMVMVTRLAGNEEGKGEGGKGDGDGEEGGG
jgi:hypothetical protein